MNGFIYNKKDRNTIIRQVNEYSYIVVFGNEQEKTKFDSRKLMLTDICTELIRNKEDLLTSQGFIRIKEYTVDAYECHCHEHNDRLIDEKINDHKNLLNYKLEF
jgi:hypothetical protein